MGQYAVYDDLCAVLNIALLISECDSIGSVQKGMAGILLNR